MIMDGPKATEYAGRIARFQELLGSHGMDGALVVQKVDLYYFAGTDQDAHLWVPCSGEPLLMVKKSLERAQQDAAVERIVPLPGFSRLPQLLREHSSEPLRMGLELDVIPVKYFKTYQSLFPKCELLDASPLIRRLRMVKSPFELSLIRRAAQMADMLFEQVPGFISESQTETDLARRVEAFYRQHGHPGINRTRGFNIEPHYGHILAGASSAVPSASPGPTGGYGPGPFLSQGAGAWPIKAHEPILVDYTACVEGYVSDQCRIYSLGELPQKMRSAHEAMIEVQDEIARQGKPGIPAGDLYELGIRMVEKRGLSRGFMGHPLPVPFIAHGIGLELDEWPVLGSGSREVLQKGMVVALEPKVAFPGEGTVGIENTFVVTEEGMKRLHRFPDRIVVL
jgi:Xaa-Pro dipeptidase